ncbi:MAG TPA: hypothetical protein VL383_02605 [Gemmatimonadaceae bacterium]|jgi:hypothetical protein|nr:hypothetical protein [Gemmatimonadaceae bacterium]
MTAHASPRLARVHQIITCSAVVVLLAGCRSDVACVLEPFTPILLDVLDSTTSRPISAALTVDWRIEAGPAGSTGKDSSSSSLGIPIGVGSGTYDLTVHALGYADWTKIGIAAAHAPCDPNPASVRVTARLQPKT